MSTRSAANWLLLVFALIVLIVVRLGLWLSPSSIILRLTRRLGVGLGRSSRRHRVSPAAVAAAVEAASRRVPRASCLTQALTTQLLLRAFGHASRLCLGVGRSDTGQFRAHIWVEREGSVLIGGSGSLALARLELERTAPNASVVDGR